MKLSVVYRPTGLARWILFAGLLGLGVTELQAKRLAPPVVEPVVIDGMRYVVPNDDGRRAYVQAWDVKTGGKVWEVTVFENRIDPQLEEDVQQVFLEEMKGFPTYLLLLDEKQRMFRVDLRSRQVRREHRMPVDPAAPHG